MNNLQMTDAQRAVEEIHRENLSLKKEINMLKLQRKERRGIVKKLQKENANLKKSLASIIGGVSSSSRTSP